MSLNWFFIFIGGFAGGIAFRSFVDFGITFSLFILLLSVFVFGYYFLTKKSSRIILLTGIFLVASGLGILRFDIADLNKGDPILDARLGEGVVLRGIIVDEPDVRENHTKLTFRVDGFIDQFPIGGHWKEVESRVLLITEHYPQFQYGDEIIIRGKLEKPKNFSRDTNEPGRPFNYVAYLAKDGIFYQMFYPEIELVAHGKGNPIRRVLFSFKRTLLENVSRVIPEPHASLLGGITFGTKQAMGKELLEAFRITGIIHIVVLSGYNVTIVAEAIGRLASFTPRVIGISLSSAAIVAFALMTGAGATVVRASIMALLVLLARATGRLYEITIALFVAAFLMLLYNPKILIFDPSFQLSFLATIGLIYIAPRLEKALGFMPTRFQLREFATATVATQLFVLPLLLYMMGEMSIVAVPVNILILFFIPITMLFGFLTGIFGFISIVVSLPFAFASYILLAYELKIIDIFASLPFASVAVPNFPLWLMLLTYMFYGWFIYAILNKKQLDSSS